MNYKVSFYLTVIVFIVMVGFILFSISAYGVKTFKVFDDGVTYVDNGDSVPNIIHEGKTYDCSYSPPWSYRGYLSPICVEIIMRSIP